MAARRSMDKPRAGQPVAIGAPPPLPLIVFTRNGAVIGTETGPAGANDVRIFFMGGLGGFGCWTRNRFFLPNGGFVLPFGTNDLHFSANGQIVPRPGVAPPPGANDIDLFWNEEGDIEGWWTKDGSYLEPIGFEEDARREFHCSLPERPAAASAQAVTDTREETMPGIAVVNSKHETSEFSADRMAHALIDAGTGPIQAAAQASRVEQLAQALGISRMTTRGIRLAIGEFAVHPDAPDLLLVGGYLRDEAGRADGNRPNPPPQGRDDGPPILRDDKPPILRDDKPVKGGPAFAPDPSMPIIRPPPKNPGDKGSYAAIVKTAFNDWTRDKLAAGCNCTETHTLSGPRSFSTAQWKSDISGMFPKWQRETSSGEAGPSSVSPGGTGSGSPHGTTGEKGALPAMGIMKVTYYRSGTVNITDYAVYDLDITIVCKGGPACPTGEKLHFEYGDVVGERTQNVTERWVIYVPADTAHDGGTFKLGDEMPAQQIPPVIQLLDPPVVPPPLK